MAVVIKLVGQAIGWPSDVDGAYVREYTPDGYGGRGHLEATRDIQQAKRFSSHMDAVEAWRQVSATHPIRRDGKPNRPLSAYTVKILEAP